MEVGAGQEASASTTPDGGYIGPNSRFETRSAERLVSIGVRRGPAKSDRYDVDALGKSEDGITVARVQVEAGGVGWRAINRPANRRDAGGTGAGDCLDGC